MEIPAFAAPFLASLSHLDPTSLLVGAVGARSIEAAVVRAVRPLPKLLVARLQAYVLGLRAAGKIDAPTLRLLAAYGRATFAWADAELPDQPGPAKMAGVLDRLAAAPGVGFLVRADRAGAEEILQACYDAVKGEVKEEAAGGGDPDATKNSPTPGGAQPTPPVAAPPA